jgi:hypothetical protein
VARLAREDGEADGRAPHAFPRQRDDGRLEVLARRVQRPVIAETRTSSPVS